MLNCPTSIGTIINNNANNKIKENTITDIEADARFKPFFCNHSTKGSNTYASTAATANGVKVSPSAKTSQTKAANAAPAPIHGLMPRPFLRYIKTTLLKIILCASIAEPPRRQKSLRLPDSLLSRFRLK
uniref:Uncharacterized protein n=1 Tax=Neisseria meningitidis alpha275 TaxID=295996 RepID=C6SJV5_NEIME|nr:hypothetical protein predicted by Glimmer/Critica [Neisseria meningitidis alpha275]